MSKVKKIQGHDLLVKVIIIGDSGVGKTNLLTSFTEGMYKDTYVATIGVDFKIKVITIDQKRIRLQIWDTAGQQRFRNITQTYYKGAAGILLVYAINNEESFRNIHSWMKQIDSNTTQNVSKILIGSKSDLQSDRKVSREDGQKIAARYGMTFIEVSAKTGDNVETAFTKLAAEIKSKKQQTVESTITIEKKVKANGQCLC